jgi:hypothetical protein
MSMNSYENINAVEFWNNAYIVNWHSYNIFMRLYAKLKDMYRIFTGQPVHE